MNMCCPHISQFLFLLESCLTKPSQQHQFTVSLCLFLIHVRVAVQCSLLRRLSLSLGLGGSDETSHGSQQRHNSLRPAELVSNKQLGLCEL